MADAPRQRRSFAVDIDEDNGAVFRSVEFVVLAHGLRVFEVLFIVIRGGGFPRCEGRRLLGARL
jgi:hypothetical protein